MLIVFEIVGDLCLMEFSVTYSLCQIGTISIPMSNMGIKRIKGKPHESDESSNG